MWFPSGVGEQRSGFFDEFLRGARDLVRGFGWWRVDAKVMLLGLVPAAIVAAVMLAGIIALAAALPGIAEALSPWADVWPDPWPLVTRILLGAALLGAAGVLVAMTFTACTIAIGDPFYERIWRSVERDRTGAVPDASYGMLRSARDALALLARGIGISLVCALIGLIPLVGGVLSTVLGIVLGGRALADELTGRAFEARGIDRPSRSKLPGFSKARMLGFGVATQVCMLVPLGAVVVMPAASAGSTLLVHGLLAEPARR